MPKRKKPKMPSLSLLDRFTYSFLFLIIMVVSFSFTYIPEWVHIFTSFKDNHVLAVTAGSSSLLSVIPTIVVFSISFCFWAVKFEEKRPIFGRKAISYGEKTRNIYPLFGQQHRPKSANELSSKGKLFKRFVSASLAIILVLSFIIGAFGIYSRYELTDTSIIKYNCFNHISNEYPLDIVTQIEIHAYHHSRYRSSGQYTFSYTFLFDNGKNVQFRYSEFRDLKSVEKIDDILHAVPKKMTGVENLEALRRQYHFNDQDWAIIQKLFST